MCGDYGSGRLCLVTKLTIIHCERQVSHVSLLTSFFHTSSSPSWQTLSREMTQTPLFLPTTTLPSPPRTTSTIRGLLPRLPLRILGFNGHAVPRSWLLLRLPPPTVGDPARPTLTGCVASRATAIPSSFAPPRTPSPRRAAWASTLGLPSPREPLRPQPQLC